ncbi:PIN domain-containing protein [Verminephrobacter aporrectodeae subsp. tuberculatae]|nr:PIN domain-containing protein [Verminephrobacter aporrectodeae subsp. tuberculatae]
MKVSYVESLASYGGPESCVLNRPGHRGGPLFAVLAQTFDGLMRLFRDRVLPFDIDAARCYAELAVPAKIAGRGFPTPDGYIAAIAASRGFVVASRDTDPYEAASVTVINPWEA